MTLAPIADAPRAEQAGTASPSPLRQRAETQEADPKAEDPYSPGLLTLLEALGGLIGVIAIVLPLATVLAARPSSRSPTDPYPLHGSEPAASIPSPWAREPGGGDPRWITE